MLILVHHVLVQEVLVLVQLVSWDVVVGVHLLRLLGQAVAQASSDALTNADSKRPSSTLRGVTNEDIYILNVIGDRDPSWLAVAWLILIHVILGFLRVVLILIKRLPLPLLAMVYLLGVVHLLFIQIESSLR